MQVGFIGAGAIGAPMIRNLLAAGHGVLVHTRSAGSAAAVVAAGAVWAPTPAAAAEGAAFVFACLPGPAEIAHVAEGPDGLLQTLPPGSVYIDTSTSAPVLVRRLCAAFAERGVALLDAPVSGGPKGAASRKLAIWVSGDESAFERARPVLDVMGDQVRYLGASGAATVAKLVHNCANYGIFTVLAEAMTLGVRAGVDPAVLFAAIRQGSLGRQRAVDRLADQFLPGEFDAPAFTLALAHKDVALATDLAREHGVPMRLAGLTHADMTEALNRGWGNRDSRVAMLLQQERSGVAIKVPRETLRTILEDEPL
ncbi:MAG: 2-hydroxy-3-oxopropionate reductase [Acetobacteraceae bacterium]